MLGKNAVICTQCRSYVVTTQTYNIVIVYYRLYLDLIKFGGERKLL